MDLPAWEMEGIRGRHLAMIFQEPMAALNPVWTIRDQIAEGPRRHLNLSAGVAYKRSLELLEALGVPSPDRIMKTYPHTLSGGMRQRVAIAMALACRPEILIADEPTTALDVTVQAQILQLIKDMQKSLGMAVLIITHDIGVVNEIADRVLVMYSGRVVESGKTADVLFSPKHPYTIRLLAAVPTIDRKAEMGLEIAGSPAAKHQYLESIEGQVRAATAFVDGCRFAERCPHAAGPCLTVVPPKLLDMGNQSVACFLFQPNSGVRIVTKSEILKGASSKQPVAGSNFPTPILEVTNLRTWFPVQAGVMRRHSGDVKAVDDITFTLNKGETLAVVGESGCGKSTLGQTLLRLVESSGGSAILKTSDIEREILTAGRASLMSIRRDIQIIFQDPFASLNSRFSVREIIEEGLKIHFPKLTDAERDQQIGDILEEVGLPRAARFRYPHEFSGGQRQRVAIARALILKPKILVLDEATSALDVSIQAQVLNLLQSLQKTYHMTFIFITHNLGVVRQIADRIAVMYLGKIVEIGPVDEVLDNPLHPYTDKLVASVPRLVRGATLPTPLKGDVPSPSNPPKGCTFHTRCPKYQNKERQDQMLPCLVDSPELIESKRGIIRSYRCHFPLRT
ncbi:MAG: ABC transporter ATP-binding protein [Proteobacteria bacterium]|nr:ABC transporter ATP-binding protein [Pseudomonadota bacterium]